MTSFGPDSGAEYRVSVDGTVLPALGTAGYWGRVLSDSSAAGVYLETVRDPLCCDLWRGIDVDTSPELMVERLAEKDEIVWEGCIDTKRRSGPGIGLLAARDRSDVALNDRWSYRSILESDSGLLTRLLFDEAGCVQDLGINWSSGPSNQAVDVPVAAFDMLGVPLRRISSETAWTIVGSTGYISRLAIPQSPLQFTQDSWEGGNVATTSEDETVDQVRIQGQQGAVVVEPEVAGPSRGKFRQRTFTYPSADENVLRAYAQELLSAPRGGRVTSESTSLVFGDFCVNDLIPGRPAEVDIDNGCERLTADLEIRRVDGRWNDGIEDYLGVSLERKDARRG